MAFYKVKIDGKEYANPQLCRAANRLGEAGIFRAVTKKQFAQKQLFDNILLSIEPAQEAQYAAIQVEVQDIDEAVSHLSAAKAEHTEIVIVSAASDPGIFKYKRFNFIKLSDIMDPKKYRNQVRMATVQVCGCIYVALDAVIDTEKQPIVVTIKE